MKIHFQLVKQGKTSAVIILKAYDRRFKGRFCKLSTGLSINPDHWDKRKERAKPIISKPKEYDALNLELDNLERIAIEFKTTHRYSESFTREYFRTCIKNKLRPEDDNQYQITDPADNIFKAWEKIIEQTKNSSGTSIAKNTVKSKKQTLNLVKRFARARGLSLSFDTINMVFYHEFEGFMHKLGLSPNSKGKHFKEIKAIMREALDRDYKVNTSFQKKSFKVIRVQPDSVFLNADELRKWWQLQLPLRLEARRDIFLIACYVGARFCDWHQIHPRNITVENGKEIFKIIQQKTRDILHIPVHPVVKMIFDKYQNNLPEIITNQKFNEDLKEIGRLADMGLATIDGEVVEKWQCISTHTARRSFATNAYLSRSMDVYQIMQCTGHKTESSFLRYLKLNGRDYAIQAAESAFFTKNSFREETSSQRD